ncbi:MAG: hypothetical protein Q9217_005710 [Psora testacea]
MSFDGSPYSSRQSQTSQQTSPPLSTPTSTITAYSVLSLIVLYYILHYLDYTNLPLSQLLWHALVRMTPSSLVASLDNDFSKSIISEAEDDTTGFHSKGHASKSNAMRRILGLEKCGITEVVHRTRTLSNLGGMLKGRPSNSPPGLGNWDNSCYQNSVLQGLASLNSLPTFLASMDDKDTASTTKGALRDLTARLNDAGNVGKTFWTPARLKNMSSWQQQDAQEYFSKVLDEVEKDMAKIIKKRPRVSGLESLPAVTSQRDLGHDGSAEEKSEDAHPFIPPSRLRQLPDGLTAAMTRNPLEGLLAQRVGCQQCGYVEGLSLVPFNCLTVSLGKNWLYDIRACLDEFTALELINGVECVKCTLLQAEWRMMQLLETLRSPGGIDGEAGTQQATIALCGSVEERLSTVRQALHNQDFSENALKKCQVGPKDRASTTKSRQSVIARPPKAMVIHINRSVYNEFTGMQSKNYANVRFPKQLSIGPWCLGQCAGDVESWNTDPSQPMLSDLSEDEDNIPKQGLRYELRAVVTHYGRHENGHYICYRRSSYNPEKLDSVDPASSIQSSWWRLNDEDVTEVSEENVLAQGGVFMLFYEEIEPSTTTPLMSVHGQTAGQKLDQSPNTQVSSEEREQASNDPPEATDPQLKALEDVSIAADVPTPPQTPSPLLEVNVKEMLGKQHEPVEEHISQIGSAIASPSALEALSKSISPCEPLETLDLGSNSQNDPTSSKLPVPSPLPPLSQPTFPSPACEPREELKPQIALQKPITPRSGRGSASRAGKAMESVAGFVQAN